MAKARAINSGTIVLGLVAIPFKVYTAASEERVEFNSIHAECRRKLSQRMICEHCSVAGEPPMLVERDDIRKGREHAPGQFVAFEDDELEQLVSPDVGNLEIVAFVPEKELDPLRISKSYFIGPNTGGDRSYRMLVEQLEKLSLMAVGQEHRKTRDELVFLRTHDGGLMLHQAFYDDELRGLEDVDLGAKVTISPKEHKLAERLIRDLVRPKLDVSELRNEYRARVEKAVEKKVAGDTIALVVRNEAPKVVDLQRALEESLAARKAKTTGPGLAKGKSSPPAGQRKAG